MNDNYPNDDKGRARLQTRRLKSKAKRLMRRSFPDFENRENPKQNHANDNPTDNHDVGHAPSSSAQ